MDFSSVKYVTHHLSIISECNENNRIILNVFDDLWLQTQYIMLLCSFKEQLQQHVYSDVTEAMVSCWELEQALHTLTGEPK